MLDQNQLKDLNKQDPIKRMVERQQETEEFSPMDPPDAYAPPAKEDIPYEAMPSALQFFMDEHRDTIEELQTFEETLGRFQTEGFSKDLIEEGGVSRFFRYLDDKALAHNFREERLLFPVLKKKMLESGDHSNGMEQRTAVDILEDDHVKMIQMASVSFSLLGLASRLPDARSRALTLDVALEQAKSLIELMRLHIFREENLVFPMAARLLDESELAAMNDELNS
jgi:hemerythrin-like domain-containing protein